MGITDKSLCIRQGPTLHYLFRWRCQTWISKEFHSWQEPDLEAKQLWIEVGALEDHIIPGSAKDNFWGINKLIAIDRNGRSRSMWPML